MDLLYNTLEVLRLSDLFHFVVYLTMGFIKTDLLNFLFWLFVLYIFGVFYSILAE